MPLIRRIGTFITMPWNRRVMFFEAWLLLGISWALIRVVPFRKLCGIFGHHMHPTADAHVEANMPVIRDATWAVRRASDYHLITMNCFPRAITGKIILRRRAVPSTLYLGVARDKAADASGLKAHAWLRSGDTIVTGHMENLNEFGVVAIFGD